MNKAEKAITIEKLHTGYSSSKSIKTVSENIDLSAEKGRLIFLTGPNGAGKTTLLKTLTGNIKPLSGRITVAGSEINYLKGSRLSKLISVVLTDIPDPGYLSVEEIITLGRSPYTGLKNTLTSEDREIIENSVNSLNLSDLKDRLFNRLSDGEKQKTMIARALCQDTEIICMDEPSSHLDFPSGIELVSFLKKISETKNKTIIVSSHNLNTALNSSDIMWLMDKSGTIHSGAPEDLALSGKIGKVFDRDNFRFEKTSGEFVLSRNYDRVFTVTGGEEAVFWTVKGLRKLGIDVQSKSDVNSNDLSGGIRIEKADNYYKWIYENREFNSMEMLLKFIKIYS